MIKWQRVQLLVIFVFILQIALGGQHVEAKRGRGFSASDGLSSPLNSVIRVCEDGIEFALTYAQKDLLNQDEIPGEEGTLPDIVTINISGTLQINGEMVQMTSKSYSVELPKHAPVSLDNISTNGGTYTVLYSASDGIPESEGNIRLFWSEFRFSQNPSAGDQIRLEFSSQQVRTSPSGSGSDLGEIYTAELEDCSLEFDSSFQLSVSQCENAETVMNGKGISESDWLYRKGDSLNKSTLYTNTIKLEPSRDRDWIHRHIDIAGRLDKVDDDFSDISSGRVPSLAVNNPVPSGYTSPTSNSPYGYIYEVNLGTPTAIGRNAIDISIEGEIPDGTDIGMFKPQGVIAFDTYVTDEPYFNSIRLLDRYIGPAMSADNAEYLNLHHEAAVESFRFPMLNAPTDIKVSAAYIDNQNENKSITVTASGGGKTDFQTDYVPNKGGGLTIVEMILEDVPRGTSTLDVKIESPEDTGDAALLTGVVVSYPCHVATPLLEQEAETGEISGGFAVGSDEAASGGAYVHVPEGFGNQGVVLDPEQKVRYTFDVAEDGLYRIKAGVYALDIFNNSFYLQVDGSPSQGYTWHTQVNNTYRSEYVTNGNGVDILEVNLSAGTHTIDVFLREDGTRLDKLALERVGDMAVIPEPEGCEGLEREGEDGELHGNFVIGNDSDASGGQYAHVADGFGNRGATLDLLQKASYCFTVAETGTYRIKGWVYAADVFNNSFYVQVDGNTTSDYLWHNQVNTSYAPEYITNGNGIDIVEIPLAAGVHTVDVFLREDGTRLDKLALESADSVQSAAVPGATVSGSQSYHTQWLHGSLALNNQNSNGASHNAARLSESYVTLVNVETEGEQFHRRTGVDLDGNYYFDNVPIGRYQVELFLPSGYSVADLNPVDVEIERDDSTVLSHIVDKLDMHVFLPLLSQN